MRLKTLALLMTPWLLIHSVAAERRFQKERDALRVASPSQIKLSERATTTSDKPIQLIVQYAPPALRGATKAALAKPLEAAVKKLGGKQEPLFNSSLIAEGSRGAAPASGSLAMSADVQSRLSAINEKFPTRAKRGVITDVPPGNSFLTAQVVEVPVGTDVNVAIATLEGVTGVTSVYPAREYKNNQTKLRESSLKEVYGIQAIKAPEVWQATSQGQGVTVAINDTGIYFKHAALAPNLWKNPGEIAGNCIDDDSNGFVDDVYGIVSSDAGSTMESICTVKNGNPTTGVAVFHPMDCDGHGSHVAGTVAAVDDGTFGLAGVAPQAKIMALKGLSDSGSGSTVGLARNIVYATDNGADIINNSWGAGPLSLPDPVLTDAIRYAAAAGVVNVFAAGNDTMDMAFASPANMEEVIAVGAIDSKNRLAEFSNFGARIDVVAPGVDINSSMPDTCATTEKDPLLGRVPVRSSDFTTMSGTSMAAPHVSGAVALLLAANPALRVDEVRAIIRASADDLGAPGFDSQFGSGRLNVARAVGMATAGKPIPRIAIRSVNPSLYRDKYGRYPALALTGAAISGKGSRITIKDYDGKNGDVVARNTRDIRNGVIGSVSVHDRPNGRYILELSTTTDLGTFHASTMLELFARAKILDTASQEGTVGSQKASFKGSKAVWMARAQSDQEAEAAYYFRVLDRSDNRAANTASLKIPWVYRTEGDDEYNEVAVGSPTLIEGAPWKQPWVAFNYLSAPFTGQASDPGVVALGLNPEPRMPIVVGREMPWIYGMRAARGEGGDRLLTFFRDLGMSTLENKVQALRLKSPQLTSVNDLVVDELLRSDPGAFLINGTLISPPAKKSGEPIFVARELRPNGPGGSWLANIVGYAIKGGDTPAAKRVLVSDAGRYVEELSSDYEMSCFLSSSNKVRGDVHIGIVEHSTNQRLKIAQGQNAGLCMVPQEKFVTYLSWDRDGVYLNGYDLRTGKTGRTLMSDFIYYSSFTPTGDGNLVWAEDYQLGTRLVELDVTAFRAFINTAARTPTPGPTGNNVHR